MNEVMIFFAGLLVLIVGAELIVRGASRLAALLGINPLLIGLTIISIGTSMPELAVGITAGLQGGGPLAVANIAGTNLANILFILGLSAFLRPLPLHLQVLNLDLPMMIVATAALAGLASDGVLTPLDGVLMLLAAAIYTVVVVRASRTESQLVKREFEDICGDGFMEGCGPEAMSPKRKELLAEAKYVAMLIAGIALTVIGADWLVDGATGVARMLAISEAIIGLSIVAIGTSAPELVTTIIATLRDERDVAIGNLLGSSIYNILLILGLASMAAPAGLAVTRQLQLFDIPLMTLVALACVPVFLTGRRISRVEGGLGVAAYLIYLIWLVLFRA
ncbi:calcium/sodium antiporter [Methanothrix sp.]|uniref:calcium/sodium antiporter n=1 Tax=Methanothrix sp. TaxID=90426 RepID=UPI00329A045E